MDVGLPHNARHCRRHSPAARPRTPPHNRQTTARHRAPKFLCFISSLQRHALVKTSKEIISSRIFHPRTVLLCGVCVESAPCTLFDLLRCVAGDERCRRNSARLTSLDDLGYRAGPPLTISGCGARRQPPPTHSADIAKGRTPGVDLTPTTSYQVQLTDLSCSSVDCVAVRRRTATSADAVA